MIATGWLKSSVRWAWARIASGSRASAAMKLVAPSLVTGSKLVACRATIGSWST